MGTSTSWSQGIHRRCWIPWAQPAPKRSLVTFTGRAETFLGFLLTQYDEECSELVSVINSIVFVCCGFSKSKSKSVERACIYRGDLEILQFVPRDQQKCRLPAGRWPKPSIYNSHDLIIPPESLCRPPRITCALPIKEYGIRNFLIASKRERGRWRGGTETKNRGGDN